MSDWKDVLAPTPECIDAARFEELTDADRAHIGTCVRCEAELALYRDVMQEESSADSWAIAQELRKRAGHRPARTRYAVYAIAATLALVIGIGAWMQRRESVMQFEPGHTVYRSARLEVIAPLGDIASAPNELRWSAVPEATRYSVQVFDVGSAQLWSAETTETHVALPPHVKAEFKPGRRLLWSVTAYGNDAVLADSDTLNVRVTP